MDQQILDEIKRLRQDLEVGAAINLIEGINTVETLALLGHFIAKRRAPNARELQDLERVARERWAAQVRHTLALVRADGTTLDERMADLADLMAAQKKAPTPAAKRAKVKARPAKKKAKAKRRR
jgi:flavin-dependent dehydrogenase